MNTRTQIPINTPQDPVHDSVRKATTGAERALDEAASSTSHAITEGQSQAQHGLAEARRRFSDSAESLGRKIDRTSTRLRDGVSRTTNSLKSGLQTSQKALRTTGERLSHYGHEASRLGRRHPGKTLLLGTALGVLAGLLLGRRTLNHASEGQKSSKTSRAA